MLNLTINYRTVPEKMHSQPDGHIVNNVVYLLSIWLTVAGFIKMFDFELKNNLEAID